MKKCSISELIPTVAGVPFAGGYYVGRFFIGPTAYALVVSPKNAEISGAWNKSTKKVTGALSWNDGLANTEAMAKAGSAIAKTIGGLKTGGGTDWYLPSRLEALMLYGECDKLKAAAAIEDSWYWTSTQFALFGAYAWCQSFHDGYQFTHLKVTSYRARAVRRVKI